MTPKWTEQAWRSDAEAWISARLTELGTSLAGPLEHSHVRPWGTTVRVPTTDVVLWFKASVAPLAFEVPLLEVLAEHKPQSVPKIRAVDASRGWLLMEDSGPILADLYPDGLPLERWQQFLRAYAQLQVDVARETERLVAAGVPDRRLPKLLESFMRMLATDRLVRLTPETALSDDELERLHSLLPRLRDAVNVLGALDLPDSVQHDDLHQWNVCVDGDGYRFIDWGDACVSNPLLSLWVPLEHGAPDVVREAYLAPWTAFRPYDDLVASVDAALLLAQITGSLKWALIASALRDDEFGRYEGVIPDRLRTLLQLACA